MQLEYLSVKSNTLKISKSIFNVIVNISLFILGSSFLSFDAFLYNSVNLFVQVEK